MAIAPTWRAPLHVTLPSHFRWSRHSRSACGICAIIPGPRTFRALINHFGGARAALAALPDLARRGGASRLARVYSRDDAERELKAAKALGVTFCASGEEDYPLRLQMIDDAPPLLAVRGSSAVLKMPMVAMVGARNASAAGVRFAERLAHDLGSEGFVIASGLARGIEPPRTALLSRPVPLQCWRAATITSIRPSTLTWRTRSWRKARWSRKCHSGGSRARATSRGATGSFPGSPWGW